jgi:glyoxylase I family protein
MFPQGIPLAAFEVEDIAAEANRPKKRGVKFTMDPTQHGGAVKLAIFSDTCGNLIQRYQPLQ